MKNGGVRGDGGVRNGSRVREDGVWRDEGRTGGRGGMEGWTGETGRNIAGGSGHTAVPFCNYCRVKWWTVSCTVMRSLFAVGI